MRWARIDLEGKPVFATVEGEACHPVDGTPFGKWTKRIGHSVPLSDVKLLIPFVPRTFYACGLNYDGHVRAMASKLGREVALPTQAEVGYRTHSGLIPSGADILIPSMASEQIHYEGELVVVIGKQAKNISESDALSCVFGYTIGNDVTDRGWQKADRILWRSKNADTFSPMGPWIDTDIELETLKTRVFVNGKMENEFGTNNMLFGVAKFISEISKYSTLQPHDMIWMGTDGASVNLKDGDIVEVEIDQIGRLSNRVRGLAVVPAQEIAR
jgi:2-keto-4-pentenoate hydratase/2-oxohepta-3-ene-1,7-dioic acid hydratase in catechol pathway